jgi:para-nitrobenzyl esterase
MTGVKKAIVKTASGKLLGEFKDDVFIFRGVPFAAPPVGVLRWMPPSQPGEWSGVRPALSSAPIAPQNASMFKKNPSFAVEAPQSEDCLYLNVWSPGLDDHKRPVMVWIHGGAFTLGSGSQADFSGHVLAKFGDVVIVTLNYRLGLLGFLNLNQISHGEIPASGNEGLLDQIAALEWVRLNISLFGGDPDNVTLFGESAGAMCVACLMTMPKAKGLFHKIISQSGSASMAKPLNLAIEDCRSFLSAISFNNKEICSLRSLPIRQLLAVQQELEAKTHAMTITTPVIDGITLPRNPLEAIRSGVAAPIPILLGTNLDEWKLFNPSTPNFQKMDLTILVSRCSKMVPPTSIKPLIDSYRIARQKSKLPVNPADLFIAIKSDHDFRIPTIRMAETQKSHNPSVFCYLFDWKSPDERLGSCHSLEIGFVFGTFNVNSPFYGSGLLAEKLSHTLGDAWISFARTGNPSCASLGDWPGYGSQRITQILGMECHLENAPYDEERKAWDAISEIRSGL